MSLSVRIGYILVLILISFASVASAARSAPDRLPQLTASEKEWIARHPVINVRISRSYPPFEFVEGDRFQGLAYDYLQLIAERTGLTFQPTSDMPWSEALERLTDKSGVDLILLITHTQERESKMLFTRDYISFPEVIFTRDNFDFVSDVSSLAGHVIASESGFVEADVLRRDVPDATLLEAETTADALKYVAVGQADAYIGNLAVGSYLIDRYNLVNVKVAAPTAYEDDSYAMAVRNDWPQLVGILEKGLDSLTVSDNNDIRNRWLSIRYEYGLNVVDIMLWVLGAVAIALIFIVQLKRMVNSRTRELQTMHDRLEDLVDERTQELQAAQADLLKAERMALLGQLTSTVSHELRNPLGSISNVLFTLRKAFERDDREKVAWATDMIERNVARCDRIVSELLDFTRRPRTEMTTIPVDRWLDELLVNYEWPDDVDWQADLQCRDAIRVDSESLRRALTNLLDNAVQALDGAGESRQVRVVCRSSEGRVEIEIADTGCGMAEEDLVRIFEPLYSTKPFGVGLGVPIVKNILTDHGGGIRYASQADEGTTVTLWLPVAASVGPSD